MLSKTPAYTLRAAVIAVLLLTMALATGCASTKVLKLDAGDNGSQVELEKGRVLSITLESNPTTGYRWEVEESGEPVLSQIGEATYELESGRDDKLVGAPGLETFQFEAMGTGDATLKLVYHRPWEEEEEPLETFSIRVTVR